MKTRNKYDFLFYLIPFSISIIIFFIIMLIFNIVPFGNNSLCINDGIPQYIPFLSSLYSKIKNGESLLYSFKGGIGYNFYVTMAYYLMSPFNLIILLFKKEHIKIAAQLIVIIKASLLPVSMAYYLKNKFKRKNYIYIIILSISYEFCSFFIAYMHNFIWLDAIILFPFILIGLDNILSFKGKIQYCILLSLCMISNFYMAAIICIFLVLYFLMINLFEKGFFKKLIYFSFFSVLAAAIAGFILIPVFYTIKSMPTGRTNIPTFSFFNNITYIFEYHLPLINIETGSSNEGNVNLYISVGVFLLSSIFIFNKSVNIKRKVKTILLVLFLLLSFNNEIANWIMHGFYKQRGIPNRFAFLYIFLIIAICYENIMTIKWIERKYIFITGFLLITFPILNSIIQIQNTQSTKFSVNIYIYCCFFISMYILLLFKNIKYNAKVILISILMISEIVVNITKIQYTTFGDSYILQNNYENAINKYKEDSFNRQDILIIDAHNANSMYNLNGVATFNSIFNQNLHKLNDIGFSAGENYLSYYGHTPITDSLFGIKYIFSQYEEILPFIFEKIDNIDGINVYRNNFYFPIGYEFEINYDDMNRINKLENLNEITKEFGNLFNGLLIKPKIISEKSDVEIKDNNNYIITSEKNGNIKFEISNIESNGVFIYNNINAKANTNIKVNNRIVTNSSYFGYISYLGNIKKTDKITISYDVLDNVERIDSALYLSSIDEQVFKKFYEKNIKKSVKNVKYNENEVFCEYNSENDTTLTFSIPYDKGWKAFVNKKETDIFNNSFLKININKGYNEIYLKFIPEGLYEGIFVSIASILILISYIYIHIIKKQKNI